MLKKRRFWLGLVLTLIFLALFLYGADFSEMGRALIEANYAFVFPALLIYFLGIWFRALRWQLLLAPLRSVASYRLFFLILIGFAINNVLPARLGLVARAYLVGEKEGISKIASGATIVVDQIFDGLALLFSIVVISFFVSLASWARQVAWMMVLLMGGSLLAVLIMASSRSLTLNLVGRLLGPLPHIWREKVEHWLGLALSGLETLRSPGKLFLVFMLSLMVWLIEIGSYYIVSLSFNLGQPYHIIFLVGSMANFGLLLPAAPGGIGPFEYFGQQTLLLFGVGAGLAAAYVGFVHFMMLLPVTVVGLGLLSWENRSLAEVTKVGGNRE